MPITARIILYCAAALITLGGLYDVFVPKLPANLAAMCGKDERACRVARELLRALGGALVAVGVTVAVLVYMAGGAAGAGPQSRTRTLMLILLLVLPSEGINSLSMYRVGSPFYVPLGFALLTVLGVLVAWASFS